METINTICVLFIAMFAGMTARILKITDRNFTKQLSALVAKVLTPFLLINVFQKEYSNEILKVGIGIFIATFISFAGAIFISKLIYSKFAKSEKYIYEFSTIFSNCGYLGFPVLQSIFGDIGLLYGAFFNAAFNIFVWSYGIYIIRKSASEHENKISLREIFVNPGTVSIAIGFLLFVFRIKLPPILFDATKMIGDTCFPLAMFVTGGILADVEKKITIFNDLKIWLVSFAKLVLVPVLSLFVMYLLNVNPYVAVTVTVLLSASSATNTVIFTEMYGGDSKTGVKCVCLSTIISILTMPLVTMLAQKLFQI